MEHYNFGLVSEISKKGEISVKTKNLLKGISLGFPIGLLFNVVSFMLFAFFAFKLFQSDLALCFALIAVDIIPLYIGKRKLQEKFKVIGFAIGILASIPVSLFVAVIASVAFMNYAID